MSYFLIKNAEVADGSGKPIFKTDVLSAGGIIKKIAPSIVNNGFDSIDASGKILSPGFIDPHGHSDISAIAAPECAGKLSQGITTEVCGNCGLSVFPVTDMNRDHLHEIYRNYDIKIDWTDINSYSERVRHARPAINLASLCGHNTARAAVTGYGECTPSPAQLKEMCRLVDHSLKNGAAGFATGLIYIPGKFSDSTEIMQFLKTLKPYAKPYTTHLRSEGRTLIEALREAIELSLGAGIGRLHVSHFKTSGKANWQKLDAALAEMDAGRARGLAISADRYPYTESMTELDVMAPEPYDKLDSVSLENILKKPGEAAAFRKRLDEVYPQEYWDTVRIISTRYEQAVPYLGSVIAEIAKNLQMPPSLLCTEILRLDAAGTQAAFRGMCHENMMRILKLPFVSCCTDETARPEDYSIGRSHPRGFGSFPRFFKLLENELPFEEIIRKMTSQPAELFAIKNRGLIAEGMAADFLLLDKAKLHDKADFAKPHAFAEGIEKIWVNGTLCYEEGRIIERSGQFLKL